VGDGRIAVSTRPHARPDPELAHRPWRAGPQAAARRDTARGRLSARGGAGLVREVAAPCVVVVGGRPTGIRAAAVLAGMSGHLAGIQDAEAAAVTCLGAALGR
jgi:hypothetical protein